MNYRMISVINAIAVFTFGMILFVVPEVVLCLSSISFFALACGYLVSGITVTARKRQ